MMYLIGVIVGVAIAGNCLIRDDGVAIPHLLLL